MKKFVLFFCLLFLVSCQQESLPKMTVKVDGQSLEVYEGSYCWGSKCVDKIDPKQIAAKHKPIIVPKNSKAVFSINSTRRQKSIDVTMFHNGAFPVKFRSFTIINHPPRNWCSTLRDRRRNMRYSIMAETENKQYHSAYFNFMYYYRIIHLKPFE
ncbi:hypothetical protein CON64_00720 [Bacillus pseudomycoides]|nr:hypothetical protein CON64_00720 [Bacillus pseudomycoides]